MVPCYPSIANYKMPSIHFFCALETVSVYVLCTPEYNVISKQ